MKVKLDMAWLSTNPGLLASAVEEASPVKRKVRELAVADLASLSSLLVEKMGPPSFKEDLVARIKGADKASVAADALISVAAITNPTSLVGVGLKYAARFFRLVRERRREEYKAFLEAWKKNVEEAFSREKLSEIIGDGGLDPVLEAISSLGLAVVVHDLSRTPYELFVPLLICDLAEELGGPALMLLDGVSHLSRFGWTIEVLPSLPDEHPGLRLACLIHTCPDLAYERLPDLMRALTDRRAIIFDMDPAYTDALCRGRPASFKAALLRGLEKAAKERLSGNLAFILYDAVSRPLPEVVKVKPSLLGRLKGALKGILAGRGEAKG
ncbi:hypothetical protein DRO32_05425 [Candidatus Bathyarchaeota archaeon]|nr:MAG: hypothetical protein DRO32_05425 [Candidatus Bathyarchaeota archaeon]